VDRQRQVIGRKQKGQPILTTVHIELHVCRTPLCQSERRHGLAIVQAMPFLHDVAHDGDLCTFNDRLHPKTGAIGVVRQGRRHGPSITCKITHPGRSLSCSQPGGPPSWASSPAFDLTGDPHGGNTKEENNGYVVFTVN
jgi:hypothetical protein